MNDDAIARQKQLLDQTKDWEKEAYSPPSFSKNMEKKIKTKKIILKNDTIISSRVEQTKNLSNVNISINTQ